MIDPSLPHGNTAFSWALLVILHFHVNCLKTTTLDIIFTSEVLAPVLTALIKEDAPGVWVRFIWRRTTIRCLLNTVGFKMFHNVEKLVLLTRTLESECLLAILRHVIIWYNMREYAIMSSEWGLVHVHCHWNLTGWKTWKMGPFDRGLLTATWDWWPSDCTILWTSVDC